MTDLSSLWPITRTNQGETAIGKRFKSHFTRRPEPKERVNETIRAEVVRVIKPDNEHVIIPVEEALEIAYGLNLDLVEVAPNASPPVCKIMDHGKYLFEKKKKEKEAKKKQHVVVLKELRFRPQTDDHDYNFKKRHAESFLKEGNKVKATVQFRGRDIIYSNQGKILLDRLAEDLESIGKIETPAKLEGKRMSMVLAPSKGSGSWVRGTNRREQPFPEATTYSEESDRFLRRLHTPERVAVSWDGYILQREWLFPEAATYSEESVCFLRWRRIRFRYL